MFLDRMDLDKSSLLYCRIRQRMRHKLIHIIFCFLRFKFCQLKNLIKTKILMFYLLHFWSYLSKYWVALHLNKIEIRQAQFKLGIFTSLYLYNYKHELSTHIKSIELSHSFVMFAQSLLKPFDFPIEINFFCSKKE